MPDNTIEIIKDSNKIKYKGKEYYNLGKIESLKKNKIVHNLIYRAGQVMVVIDGDVKPRILSKSQISDINKNHKSLQVNKYGEVEFKGTFEKKMNQRYGSDWKNQFPVLYNHDIKKSEFEDIYFKNKNPFNSDVRNKALKEEAEIFRRSVSGYVNRVKDLVKDLKTTISKETTPQLKKEVSQNEKDNKKKSLFMNAVNNSIKENINTPKKPYNSFGNERKNFIATDKNTGQLTPKKSTGNQKIHNDLSIKGRAKKIANDSLNDIQRILKESIEAKEKKSSSNNSSGGGNTSTPSVGSQIASSVSGSNKTSPDQILNKEQLRFLVKQGMKYVESTGRSGHMNPSTNALGGYQFLPYYHWNDIVDWANKQPEYKNLGLRKFSDFSKKGKNTPADQKANYDIFLKNEGLQEAWMNHYVDSYYNQVKDLYLSHGKALGLRMDEVYAFIHHQGSGAGPAAIKAGKINYKSKDGTSGNVFLTRYNKGINDMLKIPTDKNGNYKGNKADADKAIYDTVNGISNESLADLNSKHFVGFRQGLTKDGKPVTVNPSDPIYSSPSKNTSISNETSKATNEENNEVDVDGKSGSESEVSPDLSYLDQNAPTNAPTQEAPIDKDAEFMSNWFSNTQTAEDMGGNNWGYDAKDYKDDVPVADLAKSLAGAIMGADMEGEDIPLLNIQVSDAYKGFASQMAEVSKRGLSVEEEADFNNKLTKAYSIGIDQLVRSSAGNRNIVLGNQGRLDEQYQQGLADMSLESSKRRMEGLQAYGEAMKYISDYDNRVAEENDRRRYDKATARISRGEDLTEAAWTAFGNSLNYWENNRPGSVNHMSQTMRLRNMFHYDSGLKNQDDPNQMYSLAWNRKLAEESVKNSASRNKYAQIYSQLNEEQRRAMNKYGTQTGMLDIDSAIMFGEYLLGNGDGLDYNEINQDPVDYFSRNVKPKNNIDPLNVDPFKSGADIINDENNVQVSSENPINWANVNQVYDYGKIETKDKNKDLFQEITEAGTNIFNNIFAKDNSRMA